MTRHYQPTYAKQFKSLYQLAATVTFVVTAYSLVGLPVTHARAAALLRHPSSARVAELAHQPAIATSDKRALHPTRHIATVSRHSQPRKVRAHIMRPARVATSNPEASAIDLIKTYFPKQAWPTAIRVAYCESRFNANSVDYDSNGTHDRGLFQLNDGGTEQELLRDMHQSPSNLDLAFNPRWNVQAAALLYKLDGWGRWTCARVA